MRRSSMRGALRLVGLLVAGLGACAGCARDPKVTVTLTAAELQEQISRKLPLTRAGRLVTVTVHSAEVVLAEGSDRIGVRAASMLALPAGRPLNATVELEGRIRYVPAQGELWLDEARLVDLGVAAVPGGLKPAVEEVVGSLARGYLDRTPVYRLKQDDLKHSLARLVLRSAVVRNGKLVLTLGLPAG